MASSPPKHNPGAQRRPRPPLKQTYTAGSATRAPHKELLSKEPKQLEMVTLLGSGTASGVIRAQAMLEIGDSSGAAGGRGEQLLRGDVGQRLPAVKAPRARVDRGLRRVWGSGQRPALALAGCLGDSALCVLKPAWAAPRRLAARRCGSAQQLAGPAAAAPSGSSLLPPPQPAQLPVLIAGNPLPLARRAPATAAVPSDHGAWTEAVSEAQARP